MPLVWKPLCFLHLEHTVQPEHWLSLGSGSMWSSWQSKLAKPGPANPTTGALAVSLTLKASTGHAGLPMFLAGKACNRMKSLAAA